MSNPRRGLTLSDDVHMAGFEIHVRAVSRIDLQNMDGSR
jgi:hypothetical protein